MRPHRGGVERTARRGDDITDDLLAIDRVGNTDGRGFGDVGMGHQDVVDLDRGNVDSAADDDFLGAACDVEKAVGIQIAQVAGLQHAVPDFLDRAVLEQIAVGVLCAAGLDGADLSRGQRLAVVVEHDDVLVVERLADAAGRVAPGWLQAIVPASLMP